MSIVGPPSQVDWNAARHAILHLRKYMVFHNMPQLLEFILCYAHIFCPRTFFLQPSVVQTNFFSGGKAKYDLVKLDVEYGGLLRVGFRERPLILFFGALPAMAIQPVVMKYLSKCLL